MIQLLRKLFSKPDRAERRAVNWKALFKGRPAQVLNQSNTGMYIEVESGAPIGSIVKFSVTIPNHENKKYNLEMSYEGRVVRTSQKDGRLGLGIELTKPVKLNETERNYSELWTRVKPQQNQ